MNFGTTKLVMVTESLITQMAEALEYWNTGNQIVVSFVLDLLRNMARVHIDFDIHGVATEITANIDPSARILLCIDTTSSRS